MLLMSNPRCRAVGALSIHFIAMCGSMAACLASELTDAELAGQVKIHRDEWGVAHILGRTDEATLFGAGFSQAEDNFWQIEDNLIRGIGRYAEIYGESGLRNDVLNRVFEIPSRSREDYQKASVMQKRLIGAFTRGINAYLTANPDVQPRLLKQVEPWHLLAMDRHFILDFAYRLVHASRPSGTDFQLSLNAGSKKDAHANLNAAFAYLAPYPSSRFEQQVRAAIGSNEWSLAPRRTKNSSAMLLINPHQPWYGWGQFFEFHIHSEESLRFSGAGFLGSPVPSIGHNDHLGWTYTVNDPDIADVWRIEFTDDGNQYRYGDELREAKSWSDEVDIKTEDGIQTRTYQFMKTHHGPIVGRDGPRSFLAASVANLFSLRRGEQAFSMIRAANFNEWRQAVSECAIPMFNIAYADRRGNIFYAYNAAIPIRDPQFDWTRPVDGNNPMTAWKGIHPFAELPQVLNPPSGFVQNCNSTPFTTTDDGNPSRGDFPSYMAEDWNDDKRRAKISRMLLRNANEITFDQFQQLSFDTTLYWPLNEVPRFQADFRRLELLDPKRASAVKPLLDHLADWDFRATVESTQMALCLAWYEELYGLGYPAETLKPEYRANRFACLDALVKAAKTTKRLHGTWKVRWGDVHRLQRVYQKPGVTQAALALSRLNQSYELAGAPGPLGIVFTIYSTPSIPFLRPERYGVVGGCYVAAIEFGERIETASVTPFGVRADPDSPNSFDQSVLFAKGQFKRAWYYPDEVIQHASKSYHPMVSRPLTAAP